MQQVRRLWARIPVPVQDFSSEIFVKVNLYHHHVVKFGHYISVSCICLGCTNTWQIYLEFVLLAVLQRITYEAELSQDWLMNVINLHYQPQAPVVFSQPFNE